MSIYVNTNTSSLRAQSALSKATSKLSDSYAKLSSGKRINSAKDDAAGLPPCARPQRAPPRKSPTCSSA